MDQGLILQLLQQIPPDKLGQLISDMQNPEQMAQQPLLANRRVGFRGISPEQQRMRKGDIYGGPIGGPR